VDSEISRFDNRDRQCERGGPSSVESRQPEALSLEPEARSALSTKAFDALSETAFSLTAFPRTAFPRTAFPQMTLLQMAPRRTPLLQIALVQKALVQIAGNLQHIYVRGRGRPLKVNRYGGNGVARVGWP
jgi:hypothetical protein